MQMRHHSFNGLRPPCVHNWTLVMDASLHLSMVHELAMSMMREAATSKHKPVLIKQPPAIYALIQPIPAHRSTPFAPFVPFHRQPLLSFKAGKMKVSEKGSNKFHITPDLRKGTISLFKGPDDQLMHFAWKERPSGNVVDVRVSKK